MEEDSVIASDQLAPSSGNENNDVDESRATPTQAHKRLYRCHECHYVTDRKNNLKRHVMTMHERCSKALECCDLVFTNKASLREHVMESHKEGYDCRICGRSFCRKALLKRHITVHSGQKDYVCELCGYATSHKSNLDRHKRRHLPKELRYQYFKSLPLHRSSYIPAFGIPVNYKHFADKFPESPGQERSTLVSGRQKQNKHTTGTSCYEIGGNCRQNQTSCACVVSSKRQTVDDRKVKNEGNHANRERPKIWNPAISDNYRYTSTISDNYRHTSATSVQSASASGDKLRSLYSCCGNESVKRRVVATDQREQNEIAMDDSHEDTSLLYQIVDVPEYKTQQICNSGTNIANQHVSRYAKTIIDVPNKFVHVEPARKLESAVQTPDMLPLNINNKQRTPSHYFSNIKRSNLPGCYTSGLSYLDYPIPVTFPTFLRHKSPDMQDHFLGHSKKYLRLFPAPYKCPLCDVTFQDQLKLAIHSELSHPMEHVTTPHRPITLSIKMGGATCRYY